MKYVIRILFAALPWEEWVPIMDHLVLSVYQLTRYVIHEEALCCPIMNYVFINLLEFSANDL